MKRFRSALIALGLSLGAFSAPAFADEIQCPLTQARREITTPLPDGWWTTPLLNRLTDTRVQDIGGRPALMCIYGESGSIQRNAPDRQDCTARAGGFSCRPRFAPHPGGPGFEPRPRPGGYLPGPVFNEGSVSVPQTFQVNLENGSVGAEPGADLWFEAVRPGEFYLTPVHGAAMSRPSPRALGREACERRRDLTGARTPVLMLVPGVSLCVRTHEGRLGVVRVDGVTRGTPARLQLSYTVWR